TPHSPSPGITNSGRGFFSCQCGQESHAAFAPWHFLYFRPLPHGHGSFRPTLGASRTIGLTTRAPASPSPPLACSPPAVAVAAASSLLFSPTPYPAVSSCVAAVT